MSFERSPEESQEFTGNFGPNDSSDIPEDSTNISGIDTNSDNPFEPSVDDQDRYDPDLEGANLERIRREIALKQQGKNERIESKEDIKKYRISSHGDLRPVSGPPYADSLFHDSSNYLSAKYNISDTNKSDESGMSVDNSSENILSQTSESSEIVKTKKTRPSD